MITQGASVATCGDVVGIRWSWTVESGFDKAAGRCAAVAMWTVLAVSEASLDARPGRAPVDRPTDIRSRDCELHAQAGTSRARSSVFRSDGRSDLYALGSAAFFALTRRPPFEATTRRAILAMHLTRPPEPVASVRPGSRAKLVAIVDRCLSKDPADRFASGAS